MGILLPVIGWSDQRRKSNYASFQCLQALGYQSVGFTIWVLSYLVIVILGSVLLLATLSPGGGENPNVLQKPVLIIFLILILGPLALYFVLPIIAATTCALGKDFHYPFMGDRLARYLDYEGARDTEEQVWLHEDHEFRWVAAMGHFSILIALWGMLAPLTAWMLQGKNNSFLKFQSIQTLLYQAVTTVVYFIGGFLYLFGIVLLVINMGAVGGPDFNSSMGIISTVIMAMILLVSAVLILSVPLLHILGQWAGYRILKGEDYRYPLIGKLVEKQLATTTAIEEEPV
jgi:uncharacterized Tic20 family protein